MMLFAVLVSCSLSFTAPSAVIHVAPGGCAGDSIRPACLVSMRLYGEVQRTDWSVWGSGPPADSLLAEVDASGREGQPMMLIATLPNRLYVLDVRAVDVNGREACASNRVLWNGRAFVWPPWRSAITRKTRLRAASRASAAAADSALRDAWRRSTTHADSIARRTP